MKITYFLCLPPHTPRAVLEAEVSLRSMPALSGPVRWLLTTFLNLYKTCARRVLRLRHALSGQPALSPEEQRVVSGAAWDEFCDTLKAAGAAMLAPGAPRDPFNQAEGYRYLARLARAGLENYLECADVEVSLCRLIYHAPCRETACQPLVPAERGRDRVNWLRRACSLRHSS